VKLLLDIYDWVQKNLRPPSAFSWETLILLSLFSYYMSMLSADTDFVRALLINFAWIFLILGVFWGTTAANQLRLGYKDPSSPGFPLSPWITGALVSLYIFGRSGEVPREALIYWPIISAVIAALPDFLGDGLRFKVPPAPKRQNLVVLFGTQILLSCWLQFYFVIQDWVVQYPSLLADDFNQSAFVVKRGSSESATPRGLLILNSMESQLAQQLNARPWPEVERLLLKQERTKLLNRIEQRSKEQISPVEEDDLWDVTSAISSRPSGYNLQLRALWQGPRANPQDTQAYSLTKPCQITQLSRQNNIATKPLNTRQTSTTVVSRFQCQPIQGWGVDRPSLPGDRPTDSFIRL
jgi:hypothetical protein